MKVLKELDTMTSFDIKELIQDLREKGIMFSVIAGIDDPLFPVREQLKALQEKFETRDKTPLEGFYSVRDSTPSIIFSGKEKGSKGSKTLVKEKLHVINRLDIIGCIISEFEVVF
ncbi:MAG: hypothetical protein UT20_C0029G0021 [Candidatus Levybacteria bacterium GW2011_GWA1_39_11]|nr:MAG: hypothetical protein UT20_C0029G0021 [Candidatus Levybacteria bacterium GW2011_GWA1_39_11]